MKNLLVLVTLLSISCITITISYSSEYWAWTHGLTSDDKGYSIQETTDGGYITAGTIGADGLILKLDGNGDINWQNRYGDANEDAIHSILQTTDGGYVATGWDYVHPGTGYPTWIPTQPYNVWVLKLDSNGEVSWQKGYGGGADNFDYGYCIQSTSDDGYLIAGKTNSHGAGNYDLWLIKIDTNGEYVFQRTYGGFSEDWATSLEKTLDGGYIMSGNTRSYGFGGSDCWILKLNDIGENIYVEWQKTYGDAGDDYATSIQQTFDGGYVVTGYTNSSGEGNNDAFLLKLDSSGNILWQKTYGGINTDVANSIKQTTDDGYIMVGYTDSFGAGGLDALVIKLESNGDISWQNTIGGDYDDQTYSVSLTADGGYLLMGWKNTAGSSNDFWTLKLNANGEIPNCNYIIPSGCADANSSFSENNVTPNSETSYAGIYTPTITPTDPSVNSVPMCYSSVSDVDTDADGMPDNQDNCPNHPNGQDAGTCIWGENMGEPCTIPSENETECGTAGFCSMAQEDNYPPQGNGLGDACECEADFDKDGDCDGEDITKFLEDFGRGQYDNPCPL